MLIRTAISALSPAGRNGRLNILIFHRVLPQPDPLLPDEPDIARFDQMMRWIRDWFNVLPLDQAAIRLRNGTLPARAAVITFDDGYADNLLNAAPILRKHGATATFFVASGFIDGGRMWNDTIIESVRGATSNELDGHLIGLGHLDISTLENKRNALAQLIPAIKHLPGAERTDAVAQVEESCAASLPQDLMLTSAQLLELSRMGMSIGAHTVSHPILVKMDADSARQEIADSRDFLQDLLGERISLFAYPNGRRDRDYSLDHAEMVRNLGFDAAVTTNPGVSRKNTDPYQIPRFTPWDRTRTHFGLRLLLNFRQPQ